MINNYSPISSTPTSDLPSVNSQSRSSSSSSDIISSFKEIFALMTASSSMTSGQQVGIGVGDLMAPLMLLLLERLVELQLEKEPSTTHSHESSSATLEEVNSLIGGEPKLEPSGRPVTGRLTQGYHAGHHGLDIAVPVGTPIKATMDGRIVHAGWNTQGYGNLVIVENEDTRTYYAHLSSIPVSIGDVVKAGSTIGLSGNTGNSTGPHLHYEIRKNKVPVNPTAATLGSS